MFSVFLSSYRNTRESLGELEKLWKHSPAARGPTAFLVLPNVQTSVSITRQKHSTSQLSVKFYAICQLSVKILAICQLTPAIPSANIVETFNAYQYRIKISARTTSTSGF